MSISLVVHSISTVSTTYEYHYVGLIRLIFMQYPQRMRTMLLELKSNKDLFGIVEKQRILLGDLLH